MLGRHKTVTCAALLWLLTLPAANTLAHEADMHIMDAWARATPPGAPTGAVYFKVDINEGSDKLIGAETPVAGKAMLHQSVEEDGVVGMKHVDSVSVSAGEPIVFRPGGYHLMLMQLEKPLTAGDSFPLTLEFAKAGPREVQVEIKPIDTTEGMGETHGE